VERPEPHAWDPPEVAVSAARRGRTIETVTPGVAARLLGLDAPPADRAELRRAWRRFALAAHPDRRPDDPAAAEVFALGRRAHEVLEERIRRRRSPGAGEPDGVVSTREWRA